MESFTGRILAIKYQATNAGSLYHSYGSFSFINYSQGGEPFCI